MANRQRRWRDRFFGLLKNSIVSRITIILKFLYCFSFSGGAGGGGGGGGYQGKQRGGGGGGRNQRVKPY